MYRGYQTVDVLGYDPTNKKLGLKVNGADTVIPFSGGGAKLVGTYSSNTTINVSSYGATSGTQFLVVPDSWSSTSQEWNPPNPITYSGGYSAAVLTLSGNILSVTAPYVTWKRGTSTTHTLSYRVYYVGNIS